VAEQIRVFHDVSCDEIEDGIKEKRPIWTNLKNTRYESRWRAGTCAICGEHMEYCITHYHAGLHGYKSAEELIKAGKVIFD
jgi:hypothetical protein